MGDSEDLPGDGELSSGGEQGGEGKAPGDDGGAGKKDEDGDAVMHAAACDTQVCGNAVGGNHAPHPPQGKKDEIAPLPQRTKREKAAGGSAGSGSSAATGPGAVVDQLRCREMLAVCGSQWRRAFPPGDGGAGADEERHFQWLETWRRKLSSDGNLPLAVDAVCREVPNALDSMLRGKFSGFFQGCQQYF